MSAHGVVAVEALQQVGAFDLIGDSLRAHHRHVRADRHHHVGVVHIRACRVHRPECDQFLQVSKASASVTSRNCCNQPEALAYFPLAVAPCLHGCFSKTGVEPALPRTPPLQEPEDVSEMQHELPLDDSHQDPRQVRLDAKRFWASGGLEGRDPQRLCDAFRLERNPQRRARLVAHLVGPLLREGGIGTLAEVHVRDAVDAVQHEDAGALEEVAALLGRAHVPLAPVAARSQHLLYVLPPLHLPAHAPADGRSTATWTPLFMGTPS